MHRTGSNPPRGMYHPTQWISIPLRRSKIPHPEYIFYLMDPTSDLRDHKSMPALSLHSQIRVWAPKSACGLPNPRVGSQIHMWAHKSMFGLTNLRESGSILMILGTRWSRYFLFRNYYIFFLAHYLTI